MFRLMQPDVKTVINFVTVTTLSAVLASVICVCLQHYSGFPTYTDISMVNQPSTLFPAVTFCPNTYPRAKEEVLKESNQGFNQKTQSVILKVPLDTDLK